MNDQFLCWIHHERILVVPGIERFDGTTVHSTDGAERDYDTISLLDAFATARTRV